MSAADPRAHAVTVVAAGEGARGGRWLALAYLLLGAVVAAFTWRGMVDHVLAWWPRFWNGWPAYVLPLVLLGGEWALVRGRRLVRTALAPAGVGRVGTGAALVAWMLWCAALWWGFSSPLGRSVTLLVGFVVSSLWLVALSDLGMPGGIGKRSLAVTGVCLLVAGAFVLSARRRGVDGTGRAMYAWRWSGQGVSGAAPLAGRPAGTATETPLAPELAVAYPGYRGADGLANVRDVMLETDWAAHPPREVWRNSLGAGWSGFAIAAGRAFTQEQRGAEECVTCYDLASGKLLWVHADAAYFASSMAGDGPRATPTVVGERVYTLGATGRLNCLDARRGEQLWSHDLLLEHGGENQVHGLAGSPCVDGGLVMVSVGGPNGHSLVAYDATSGELLWQAGSDPAGYGTPLVVTLCGTRQVVILNAPGLSAHNLATGTVLWTLPWENSTRTNCSQPVPLAGDRLLVTTGYGKGCAAVQVSRDDAGYWSARTAWESRELKTKFTSAVVHEGYAYGLDDGILNCVDLSNGRRRWKAGRYGHGQLLLAGEVLIVQTEPGEVVLVAARPERHAELARWPALAEKTWNTPAVAGDWLLVRNDREGVALRVALARGGR